MVTMDGGPVLESRPDQGGSGSGSGDPSRLATPGGSAGRRTASPAAAGGAPGAPAAAPAAAGGGRSGRTRPSTRGRSLQEIAAELQEKHAAWVAKCRDVEQTNKVGDDVGAASRLGKRRVHWRRRWTDGVLLY